MAVSLEAFLYAITSNETGSYKNPYSAVGPLIKGHRAYGKYQIMDFHIGPWSKQYLGRSVSLQEYRNSPDIQEQLARAVLTDYYKKYGADVAASMWFSGQKNPNSSISDGHWTVKQYVQEMNKAAAKYKGGSGTSGTSAWQPWDWKTSKGSAGIDSGELASKFGYASGLLNAVPELKKLFDQAVKDGWTKEMFQARLQNTTWWKTTTKSQRDYLVSTFDDPASVRATANQLMFKVNEMASQMGVHLQGTKHLNDFAFGIQYYGWTDAEVKYRLADYVGFSPEGTLGGAGGQFQNQMSSLSFANGVKLNLNWYAAWWKEIIKGTATAEQAAAWIRNQAAAQFPGFRDQILAGQNVMDIANPYIQSMGNILELNANDIDLFDPQITGALNYHDPKTGVVGAKPLWAWEVELKKDPRWLKTGNAREGIMGVAHKVAQDLGVLY